MFKSKSKAKNKLKFADVDAVKKRFLLLNRERLRRGEECMRSNQRDFLDFLPLLFHINHPSLPGYVSKGTPSGICDYAPTQRALEAAKKYIHRFEYRNRALPRYDILSMFLMGSSGTIAYSKKSDFDIWLCHQHDIPSERLAELQLKANAIETWADEQGLEVHFFLMDAENFRQGKIVDLSSESSGTAQYYLLLEEFYRTGLLLAGRFPVWWLVPVEEEENYDAYVQNLYQSRLINESEAIDFGGIPTLPAEEFFGAAVWQLFKGIDSPYKSVLKLLLMEVYAAEYPDIDLLCLRFKKAIFDGENDLDKLDPYLMLYKKLEEYLSDRAEEERLELVRRCFYFKVNQKLSRKEGVQYDWRRDLLRSMTNAWGWEQEYLAVMDRRQSWKIKQVLSERAVLVRELTYTYQFLSAFAREHAQLAAINQHDLNALGRKLYAAFERKTGKVEIVNRGISQDVFEPLLTLYQIRQRGREGGWALLSASDSGSHDLASMVALKRGRHVIEVLAWGYFNGLIRGTTVVKVIKHAGDLDSRQLEEFARSLEKALPANRILATDIEDLGRAVKVLQAVLVINLGHDPLVELRRSGAHLASNRTDAFSYGGMYGSLIGSVDQILLTSWKEVITSHYQAGDGLLDCFSNYFRMMPPSKGTPPPRPTILCYTQNHAITIRQRVERLFDDLTECFYGAREKQNNRYIFCIQRDYYVLYLEDDLLRHQRISDYGELLRYLSKGRQNFGHVVMDANVISDNLLPLVFKFNKPGVVQFFYKRENGVQAEVYVVDENGSLFCQKHDIANEECLLGHYSRFFDAVLQRQLFQIVGQGEEGAAQIEVEYYSVGRDRQGQYQVSRRAAHDAAKHGYTSIQVIASRDDDSGSAFTVYCDEKEFSSLEFGSNLFNEVAGYILARRRSRQPYPVYITDIDLTPEMFADYPAGHVPVVEFLNYKKNIEAKLNQALESLKQVQPLHPR